MSGEYVDPLTVPDGAPRPVAAFPPNGDEGPAAGSVLCWTARQMSVKIKDLMGFPEGGF